jgi:hypothetical protein
LVTAASQELKNLLENKHLYQDVTIPGAEILKQQLEAETTICDECSERLRVEISTNPIKIGPSVAFECHSYICYICRDQDLPPYWIRAARSVYAIPHCCKRLTSSAATPASRNFCAASHTFPPLISP